MRDSVNKLFQQRFQGHETPVDPGVWEGIQQQMVAAPAADSISTLFKERFQGHELPVDPSAWAHISSQLGHTVVAGTAASTVWGWVAAGVTAVAVTTGVFLTRSSTPNEEIRVSESPKVGTEMTTPSSPQNVGGMADQTLAAAPTPPLSTKARNAQEDAYPVRKPKAIPPSGTGSLSASTPSSAAGSGKIAETTPAAASGQILVTDIISDLTEKVIQQPRTAQPEPGLSSSEAVSASQPAEKTEPESAVALGVEAPAPLPKLFMPNTFTPNGDQVNDTYTVSMDGFQSVMIRVYSLKSNSLVFSTNNAEPWTGANCEDGMYMVAAEARTADGRTVSEGKVVWLNRNPVN
jgi:hypothetical protein